MRLAAIYAGTGGILLQKRSQQRQDYRLVELKRWSEYLGIPVKLFPKHYPISDELASCALIASKGLGYETGLLANAFLRAIWALEQDISDERTLIKIVDGLGFDGTRLIEAAKSQDAIAQFDRNTQEAQDRGVFGSPFYFFEKEMYWGQDRLQFLEDVLAKATGKARFSRLIPESQGVTR
jgi:2-hydroxychromene-2-carboxylate isomerase